MHPIDHTPLWRVYPRIAQIFSFFHRLGLSAFKKPHHQNENSSIETEIEVISALSPARDSRRERSRMISQASNNMEAVDQSRMGTNNRILQNRPLSAGGSHGSDQIDRSFLRPISPANPLNQSHQRGSIGVDRTVLGLGGSIIKPWQPVTNSRPAVNAIRDAEPLHKLGYGCISYKNLLLYFFWIMMGLSILNLPAIYIFSNGSGYETTNRQTPFFGDFSKLTLGNMGYSSVQCKSVPISVGRIGL